MLFFYIKTQNSEVKMFIGKVCFNILKLIFQTAKEKIVWVCQKNLVIQPKVTFFTVHKQVKTFIVFKF